MTYLFLFTIFLLEKVKINHKCSINFYKNNGRKRKLEIADLRVLLQLDTGRPGRLLYSMMNKDIKSGLCVSRGCLEL